MEDFIHAVDFTRYDGFHCVALLRLRGFLHAFHLVEMTIPQKNVISSEVERSPSVRYEQRCLSRRFHAYALNDKITLEMMTRGDEG